MSKKCCTDQYQSHDIDAIIHKLKISEFKKNILIERYLKQVSYFEKKAHNTSIKYNSCRIIMSLCSMALPTLQSIQTSTNTIDYAVYIFWGSIVISFFVMFTNGIISLFALDKKYHEYRLIYEKLKTEGWLYFELSGIYNDSNLDHETGFIQLCNNLETIVRNHYLSISKDEEKKPQDNTDPSQLNSTVKIHNTKDTVLPMIELDSNTGSLTNIVETKLSN